MEGLSQKYMVVFVKTKRRIYKPPAEIIACCLFEHFLFIRSASDKIHNCDCIVARGVDFPLFPMTHGKPRGKC